MKYIVVFFAALVSTVVAYTTIDENIANRIKIYNIYRYSDEQSKKISHTKIWIIVLAIFLLNIFASRIIFFTISDKVNIVKMYTALVCISGASCNDYRVKRIPNIFPLVMAVIGLCCLAIGYFSKQDGAMAYIVSSLYATVGVAICMILISILTKQGIGMGDIKLLCALSLIGGVYTICGTLFFGIIFCAIAAVCLLITKRKTMKEALPFGPFIYIGYLISIYMSIY